MLRPPLSLIAIILLVLLWFLPVLLAYALKKNKLRDEMMMMACRGMLWFAGVSVRAHNSLSNARPLMLVANHISYMDIIILGSLAPCRFTPKIEIAKWPAISTICKILGCVFVERSAQQIKTTQLAVSECLQRGEVVCIFPEATTGDGKRLIPFKPALFEVATQESITVQPVAISYRKICNLPIGSDDWPAIAWYGDMTFMPHVWKFLSLGKIDVEVSFLPTLSVQPEFSRKTLASLAQTQIADEIELRKSASRLENRH